MRKANPTSGRKTAKAKNRAALSAQQTIPYVAMHPDGVCKLPGGLYTKTVEYEDINYSVASTEDQTAIFSGWSSFLNYFDSSLPFQLSFINRRSHSRSRYQVNIPKADDNYNSVRDEFTGMLKNQIAKSNNGIERSKYITFGALGGDSERTGFRWVALLVAVIFVVTEAICCASVKETGNAEIKTATVGEMFKALFSNDQALVVVGSIVLINSALYLTSNFIIYFFKYDFGGTGWKASYTLFSTIGGAAQILGMMVLYPVLRKKLSNTAVFTVSLGLALGGYAVLLLLCLTGFSGSLALLCVPGVVVFACNGMLSVLTTLFLSNSVDYGQLKTGRREESVIFSMQTFVVKAASGVAVFLTGIGLDLIGLAGNAEETGPVAAQSAGTLLGLRLMMTVLPMAVLAAALVLFRRRFTLTDDRAAEISAALHREETQNG